jgi:hypothetical protein
LPLFDGSADIEEEMTVFEVMSSGLLGAVIVLIVGYAVRFVEQRIQIRGNWGALHAEVQQCGLLAETYRLAGVAAPSYRLPTICYQSCLPALLSLSGISEEETCAVLKFYSQVETVNRGLDQADMAYQAQDDARLQGEFSRLLLKCAKIERPAGALFAEVREVSERRKSQPGEARIF